MSFLAPPSAPAPVAPPPPPAPPAFGSPQMPGPKPQPKVQQPTALGGLLAQASNPANTATKTLLGT